jgi:hypothetical protein
MFIPYVDEIIGYQQYEVRCDGLSTDHMFCIRYMMERSGSTKA